MSCGVGHRRSSDPALLWLWHRPVATAPIRPLAWEPPYDVGAALEKAKRPKKKKKKKKIIKIHLLEKKKRKKLSPALKTLIPCVTSQGGKTLII